MIARVRFPPRCFWCFYRTISHRTTQEELLRLYLGENLLLDERYAQQLTAIFFSLMYSTGIPILVTIALVFFMMMYWVDKFMFCRVYKTPPQYVGNDTVILYRCQTVVWVHLQYRRC